VSFVISNAKTAPGALFNLVLLEVANDSYSYCCCEEGIALRGVLLRHLIMPAAWPEHQKS
jgi:hypothetical protein